MKNNIILLKNRPIGMPAVTDFEFVNVPMPMPLTSNGELLLKSIYISVDPYLRGKMSGTKMPRFELNEPIVSKIIAEVVESNNEQFGKGDFVTGYLNWQEY